MGIPSPWDKGWRRTFPDLVESEERLFPASLLTVISHPTGELPEVRGYVLRFRSDCLHDMVAYRQRSLCMVGTSPKTTTRRAFPPSRNVSSCVFMSPSAAIL
ncbi:hypothetical protein BaRGS_00008478, partial [Batillaria attramentaria]